MTSDDVPAGEMFASRRDSEALDAAVRGEQVEDAALAALVGDLRASCVSREPRRRSPELVAYAGTGEAPLGLVTAPQPRVHPGFQPSGSAKVAAAVAAFLATLTGKLVFGGAVAAATLGGLHATEVVDVPLLPDRSEAPPTAPVDLDLDLEFDLEPHDGGVRSDEGPVDVPAGTDGSRNPTANTAAPAGDPAPSEQAPADAPAPGPPTTSVEDRVVPPATNPPATSPPAKNPPATGPPATNPPASNPPSAEAGDARPESSARTGEAGEADAVDPERFSASRNAG